MAFVAPGFSLAQVKFKRTLGLDAVVNTFSFDVGGASFGTPDLDIMARLQKFYNTVRPNGTTIAQYMSALIDRTQKPSVYIRDYNDPPATPGREIPWSDFLAASGSSTNLPPDVAAVMTFQGDAPNTPRTRGRVYIGNLNTLAVTASTGLLSAGLLDAFAAAGAELAATDIGLPVEWVVVSNVNAGMATRVTNGYSISNADTQRRRDYQKPSRVLWTV